jgi:hypothetical protein
MSTLFLTDYSKRRQYRFLDVGLLPSFLLVGSIVPGKILQPENTFEFAEVMQPQLSLPVK